MTDTELYLASLTEKERQAYEVAKTHLGTLYDLENTNGYLTWIQKKKSSSKT
jgi:hypothetical protein